MNANKPFTQEEWERHRRQMQEEHEALCVCGHRREQHQSIGHYCTAENERGFCPCTAFVEQQPRQQQTLFSNVVPITRTP